MKGTEKRRAGLYARVSTKNNGQDPETQLIALREYAAHRGFEVVDSYVDIGISGAQDRRPELDRLMADARRRKLDAVLVARFDRFARSTKHLVVALEEFSTLGIDFISLNESIDTSSPMGRMVFVVLAGVAELERSIIKERVQAGVDRARRQGKRFGRPAVIVDRHRVAEMKASGQSIKSIALECGIARATVRTILARVAESGTAAPELSI